jgi:hypothetical protein
MMPQYRHGPHEQQHHHHRRNSSVTSLSASAAKNPEKIEKLQAFDKWRTVQTDLSPDLMINALFVHLSHRSTGQFVIECCGPSGHWMLEKSLKQMRKFESNLILAFPVEAGLTGRPRILPKLRFPNCPKWLLLKKEIYFWYRYQIEQFMRRLLLECSIFVAKSRLVEEFLGTDLLTVEEEMEETDGTKFRIGTPMSDKSVLRCKLGVFDITEDDMSVIVTVLYDDEVYPLVNMKTIWELEQTFSFLKGQAYFYAIENGERILLDDENFNEYCSKNNQLLYLEISHE